MQSEKVKILLIEDCKEDAFAISAMLSDMDSDVTVAGDGVDGLNAIDAIKPDLVLLDISLPVLDGVSVLRELKKRQETIPVIIVTGYRDKRNEVFEVKYENLINILYKPIEGTTLELLVKFFAWRKRGEGEQ